MGSFASKAWNEMNEYYYKSDNSMQREDCVERTDSPSVVVGTDPRSPALDFDRTPIQVIGDNEKTLISPKDLGFEDMKRESNDLNQLLDPRSPTYGIHRTPIDLASNDSMTVQMSALRLSFDTSSMDSTNNSIDCLLIEDKCDSKTPISDDKDMKNSDNSSGHKVRTPLGSVRQKQTPNRNVIRQRKQLEITKRAHFNSHRMKNKTIESIENNVITDRVIDDKENL